MARLILTRGESVFIGGEASVVGTTDGAEIVTVVEGVIRFDASFNTGGDTINLPGQASDYTVSSSGAVITLQSATTTAIIPAGPAGATITFDGGTDARLLSIDPTTFTITLGDTIVSRSPQTLPDSDASNETLVVTGWDGSQELEGGDGFDVLRALVTEDVSIPDASPFSGFERIEVSAQSGVTSIALDFDDINAPSFGDRLVVDASALPAETAIDLVAFPDVSAYSVTFIGGAGGDYLDADNARGGDLLVGGPGGDELWAGSSAATGLGDRAFGGEGDDFLNSSGSRFNALYGEGGDDTFFLYDEGAVLLDGGVGNDDFYTLEYLGGDVRVRGGEGSDTIFTRGELVDADFALVESVEALVGFETSFLTLGANAQAAGIGSVAFGFDGTNSLDATAFTRALLVDGSNGDDVLRTGSGTDRVAGLGGADTLQGGAGADLFVYFAASDSIDGIAVDTILDFAPGEDRIAIVDALATPDSFIFRGSVSSIAEAEALLSDSVGDGGMLEAVFVTGEGGGSLWIDTQNDGTLGTGDMRIEMDGVGALAASDFGFYTTADSGAAAQIFPDAPPTMVVIDAGVILG
ncbi:calcium-binding protein [Sphingomicrobium sp. XHP0235]|uniref:calcium-binding protein n=1 Tax=Sphingomicrobium aquimarinum TaxID=3133971 RepID=UPI0031FE8B3C